MRCRCRWTLTYSLILIVCYLEPQLLVESEIGMALKSANCYEALCSRNKLDVGFGEKESSQDPAETFLLLIKMLLPTQNPPYNY